jgi:predicted nuclease of predicted toxin-antitoxin system
VKLLIDENLSRRLVARLSGLFPGSIHVTAISLAESPDAEVWEYAKANGLTILTADADFFELTTTLGPPPKVLWLRRWSHAILLATLKMFSDEKRFGLPGLRLTLSWVYL